MAKHTTRTEDPTVTTVMAQAQPVAVTVNVPEQPAPQVTVNVPERSVTVNNDVAPATTPVTLNVQPAQAEVKVENNIPERQTIVNNNNTVETAAPTDKEFIPDKRGGFVIKNIPSK